MSNTPRDRVFVCQDGSSINESDLFCDAHKRLQERTPEERAALKAQLVAERAAYVARTKRPSK